MFIEKRSLPFTGFVARNDNRESFSYVYLQFYLQAGEIRRQKKRLLDTVKLAPLHRRSDTPVFIRCAFEAAKPKRRWIHLFSNSISDFSCIFDASLKNSNHKLNGILLSRSFLLVLFFFFHFRRLRCALCIARLDL